MSDIAQVKKDLEPIRKPLQREKLYMCMQGGAWPHNNDIIEYGLNLCFVVAIGTGDDKLKGHAMTFH